MYFSKFKFYKKILRNVIFTLFLIIYCSNHANSFDLDMTVDDDIRKNYNSSKLLKDTNTEEAFELPDLPEKLKSDNNIYVNDIPKTAMHTNSGVKISKGTSFNVINSTNISDWQAKGNIVMFKTEKAINKKKYSIPQGTIFKGEIVETHQPQITCNGGLVVIKIYSMTYKGQNVPINAYLTKADDKFIFFNNIKGERTYLKTVWKNGNWGRTIFNKMLSLTINLGSDSATLLFSPFPVAYGTICLGANTIISPITAFFQKGKHVSIKSGNKFRIKLSEDAFLN